MKTSRITIDGYPDIVLTRESLRFEVAENGALHAVDNDSSYFIAAPGRWISVIVQPAETTPASTRA